MSVATNIHDLCEVEAFYKRWGPDVLVFCRLFLGDEPRAETVSSKAFLEFYRESSELPITGEIPSRLIGFAFQAMQSCRAEPQSSMNDHSLENCILRLECRPRAAFIMRNVLRMSWPGLASATGLSIDDARQVWLKGMLRVRDLLPRDFFER
jgi:DNA-directed RNA polymerase specialized sigma24 family protein